MTDPMQDSSGIPPVDRLRQEVDRWMEAVRSTGERAMETLGLAGANRPSTPAVDVIEYSAEVVVQVDLPGIAAEVVELTLVGNMLTIAANRVRPELPPDARIHSRERCSGRFHRSIPLPSAVNDNAIKAETKDGLLTVTLQKASPTVGRSIPVTTSGTY